MSNTKIVIDKDVFDDMMYYLKMADADISFKHTEIQIDQSIEKPIDLSYSLSINQQGVSFAKLLKIDLDKYISQHESLYKYATQQQIIEQLKVKDVHFIISDASYSMYYPEAFKTESEARVVIKTEYQNRSKLDGCDEFWRNRKQIVIKVTHENLG